jgi:hypothetical protein
MKLSIFLLLFASIASAASAQDFPPGMEHCFRDCDSPARPADPPLADVQAPTRLTLPVKVQLPLKVVPTIRVHLSDGKRTWWEPLPVTHRTIDRNYLLSSAAVDASMIADVQYSLYFIHRGAHEINPIFGKHPNALRYYEIQAPIDILVHYMTWKYKREDDALRSSGYPGHKYAKWHLIDDLITGVHVFDVVVMSVSN